MSSLIKYYKFNRIKNRSLPPGAVPAFKFLAANKDVYNSKLEVNKKVNKITRHNISNTEAKEHKFTLI